MKHKMQIANKDFVDGLVKSAAHKKEVRVIVAEDRADTKDEARQSAISYWMLGYTWDEIEVVLEDFEYPKDIVNYALKQAQEYAAAVLKDGPFSVFEDGQKVKLVNGSSGTVLDRRKEYMDVWSPLDGKMRVSASQLDNAASVHLTCAHQMRQESAVKVRKAQEDPEIEQTKEFKTYVKDRAPAGMGQRTPMFDETPTVDFLPETLTRELARIQDLQARVSDLERERKEYQGLAADVYKEIKDVDAEKADLAQRLYGQITAELDVVEDAPFSVFMRTADKFIILDRLIAHNPRLPSVSQKFAAVLDFITDKYPEIIGEVEEVVAHLEDENVVIEETIRDMLAIYPPKKRGNIAQALPSVKNWIMQQWNTVAEWLNTWETSYRPVLDAGLQAIDDLASEVASGEVTASVKTALLRTGSKV